MSNYYNREDAVALINLEIKANKEALDLFDGIIKIVERFDGKVLNKRFETALQKNVSDHICAYKSAYGDFRFYYSIPDRSVKSTDSEYCYNYIDIQNIYLIVGDMSACLTDDGRICAEDLIEMLEYRRDQIRLEVSELESSVLMLDKTIEQHEKLVTALYNLRKSIPRAATTYVTELHAPRIY